jgi:hypothetical protein
MTDLFEKIPCNVEDTGARFCETSTVMRDSCALTETLIEHAANNKTRELAQIAGLVNFILYIDG